jgi:DNA modification methylase
MINPYSADDQVTQFGKADRPPVCYYQDAAVRLLVGDARHVVATLPSGSIAAVVTSPPYWGLRDYRVPGQYGHEPTIDDYVAHLRAVFREVRRVLAPGGSLWLNLGDSYGGSWGNYVAPGSTAATSRDGRRSRTGQHRPPQSRYRPKNLLGVPWHVAHALHTDGWALTEAVVWHKPNARPESVRDRLAGRSEWIFHLQPQDATQQQFGSQQPVFNDQVWSVPATTGRRGGHAAVGPVEIATRCLHRSGVTSGVVLDPFSGTATTGIAAHRLGCSYIGIELNPTFHATARQRLRHAQSSEAAARAVRSEVRDDRG